MCATVKKTKNFSINDHIKKHCLRYAVGIFLVSFIVFIILTIVALYKNFNFGIESKGALAFLTILISAIGLIFTSLKYKLDQANYNKDLFEKRFEIFSQVEQVLWEWGSSQSIEQKVTDSMMKKLSGELLRKSYYIFDNATYQFIKSVRDALIDIKTYSKYHHNTLSNEQREKLLKAEKYLSSLLKHNNLPDKFVQLKISDY